MRQRLPSQFNTLGIGKCSLQKVPIQMNKMKLSHKLPQENKSLMPTGQTIKLQGLYIIKLQHTVVVKLTENTVFMENGIKQNKI